MDRYKFRGKRVDNGEWVYGYYRANQFDNHFITVIEEKSKIVWKEYEVDPKTVGQWTGRKDIKGTDIYDGDSVEGKLFHATKGVVKWGDGLFQINGISLCTYRFLKVIGNPLEVKG